MSLGERISRLEGEPGMQEHHEYVRLADMSDANLERIANGGQYGSECQCGAPRHAVTIRMTRSLR